jgi:hypothetical protein
MKYCMKSRLFESATVCRFDKLTSGYERESLRIIFVNARLSTVIFVSVDIRLCKVRTVNSSVTSLDQ